MCVFVASRSHSHCAKKQSVLWAVGGVELPCVQRWAGRIVVKGFTAPSVANSVKVRFNREKVNSQIPEIQKKTIFD